MKRIRSCMWMLSLALSLLASSCDPARDGYFWGEYPEPVRIEGGAGLTDLQYSLLYQMPQRRWGVGTQMVRAYGGAVQIWAPLAVAFGYLRGADGLGADVVAAFLAIAPRYVFVLSSPGHGVLQPMGPSGPSLGLRGGYQIFRDSCSASRTFEEVPIDTPILYDAQAASAGLDRDSYLATCGVDVPRELDLGERVAVLVTQQYAHEPIWALSWDPSSGIVYILDPKPSLRSYSVATGELGLITEGDFTGPLDVAAGGEALIVDRYLRPGRSDGEHAYPSETVILYLPPATPKPIGLPKGSEPCGLALSPDGNTLAFWHPSTRLLKLIDVPSGNVVRTFASDGLPVAWHPSGQSVLLCLADGTSDGTFRVMGLDGTWGEALSGVPGPFASPNTLSGTAQWRAYWPPSGPRTVVQGADGVIITDVRTLAQTVLVEKGEVAPPSAPLAAVVATDQVFAWAVQCWDFGETACTSELRRLSVGSGRVDVVARADGALPFAVSPDGLRLAVVHDGALHIKSLQP